MNAYHAKLLTDLHAIRHLTIVSSDFHLTRVQKIFEAVYRGTDCHITFEGAEPVGLTEDELNQYKEVESKMMERLSLDLKVLQEKPEGNHQVVLFWFHWGWDDKTKLLNQLWRVRDNSSAKWNQCRVKYSKHSICIVKTPRTSLQLTPSPQR